MHDHLAAERSAGLADPYSKYFFQPENGVLEESAAEEGEDDHHRHAGEIRDKMVDGPRCATS